MNSSSDSPSPRPSVSVNYLLVVALIAGVVALGYWRTALVLAVVACGVIDAVVTLWFDASGSLKIYNGRFF